MIDFKNKKAWWELEKFIVRVAALGAGGAVIAALINLIPNVQDETLKYVFGSLLVFADKWIHENENIKYTGIIPW